MNTGKLIVGALYSTQAVEETAALLKAMNSGSTLPRHFQSDEGRFMVYSIVKDLERTLERSVRIVRDALQEFGEVEDLGKVEA